MPINSKGGYSGRGPTPTGAKPPKTRGTMAHRVIDTLTPLERISCGMPLPGDLEWIQGLQAKVAELDALMDSVTPSKDAEGIILNAKTRLGGKPTDSLIQLCYERNGEQDRLRARVAELEDSLSKSQEEAACHEIGATERRKERDILRARVAELETIARADLETFSRLHVRVAEMDAESRRNGQGFEFHAGRADRLRVVLVRIAKPLGDGCGCGGPVCQCESPEAVRAELDARIDLATEAIKG